MDSITFSRYRLQSKDDLASWVPGRVVNFDPYDGFYDQGGSDDYYAGQPMSVVVDKGDLFLPDKSSQAAQVAREALWGSMFLTAERLSQSSMRLETRSTFGEVVDGLVESSVDGSRQVLQQVAQVWQDAADKRRAGRFWKFGFWAHLPTVSAVRSALTDGLSGHPDLGNSIGSAKRPGKRPYSSFVLVERVDESGVRVIALGPCDVESCRIFHIPEGGRYEEDVALYQPSTPFQEQIDFWSSVAF